MTMFLAPYTAIADIDGSPLDAGFLYFGEFGKNPETYPISVYWDPDFAVPAAQPIRTRNGYPIRNGSPCKIYLKQAEHSLVVKNKNLSAILVETNNKGISSSMLVRPNGQSVETSLSSIYSDLSDKQQQIDEKPSQQYLNEQLSTKAPQATTYTKIEVDSALSTKAPQSNTYTKAEVDTTFAAYVGGRKAYTTLALAQAAQSSLPANTAIEVTNDGANNGTYQWNGTTLTKSAYDPKTQAVEESKQYSEDLAGNLRNLNDNSYFTNEFELSSTVLALLDSLNNILYSIDNGILHFQIPVDFAGNPSVDSFFKALESSYTLLASSGEYSLSSEADYAIVDSLNNLAFSIKEHQELMKAKEIQDLSYELLNPIEYALSLYSADVLVDSQNNVLYSTEDYLRVLSFIDTYKPSYNQYIPSIASASTVSIFDSSTSIEKVVNAGGTPTAPRQLQNDCVEWDIDDAEVRTMFAQAPNFTPHPLVPRKRLAFWGHSFVENPVMAQTVATLTGLKTYNFGKSGLRSYGIAGRHNSPSIKYKPVGDSIPASGSVNLQTSSLNGLWCMFGFNAGVVTTEQLKCTIAGIDGYIMWDGTNCVFTRETTGSSVTVADYVDCIVKPYTTQPTAQIAANTLYTQNDECINILWLGRNNIDDTDLIISNYQSTIESLKTKVKRFVIMPEYPSEAETTGTARATQIALINSTIKSLYPQNYCEINGVDALQNFKNHHNPAFADDVADVANGVTPRTLRYDNLHPSLTTTVGGNGASPYAANALHAGAVVNAEFINQFLINKGWL